MKNNRIMKNVKQAATFKLVSTSFMVLAAMLLLISCRKDTAEMTSQDNTQSSALSSASPSRMSNNMATVPFEETLFVPCASGGAGENVTLTGTSNFVYQMRWNDQGFSLVYHTNSQGVTGVGVSSGETFVGTDGIQGFAMGSWVNNQWIGTTIEQTKIIGKNTKYTVKYKYQLIVTPDGNVTVSTREKTIDCTN